MANSWTDLGSMLIQSLYETVLMVGPAILFSALIGLPLGIILVITREGNIAENRWLNSCLSTIVNIFRSVPFVILMVAIVPITKALVGSTIGTKAAVVPLVFYAGPYIGRLVETSLLEVDKGVVEAFIAMGATPSQIILRVLLPEAVPSLVLGLTIATIGLIGASAMAGAIGGGGLGDLAIRYGYQQFETDVMVVTVVALIVLVQAIQSIGNLIAKHVRHS